MARLILNPGDSDERVFELTEGTNTIGRTQANAVFVLHTSLSRRHAEVRGHRGRWSIADLGSKNGTFVDGVRIESCDLGRAHEVKCGDVVFSFVAGESRSSARPPSKTQPSLVCRVEHDLARLSLTQLLSQSGSHAPPDRPEVHPPTPPTVVIPLAEPAPGTATALPWAAGSAEERAREKLQILLKVSEILSSPASIDEVLATILELAFQILDIDRGTMVMVDAHGEPVPRVSHSRVADATPGPSFSRHIVDYVLSEGVGTLFADAQDDVRVADAASIVRQSICASMCVPLRPRDGRPPIGALYVDNLRRPYGFNQEDLEFVTAFANQAAVAVENATLHVQLAQEAVMRNTLVRFFPPTTIDAIVRGGGSIASIDTHATVLFCDISDYTELSSRLPPREIISLLNAYFPVMADIVFRHEGTLEKYIGDALLAVWGAPLRTDNDALRAVLAAIDMQTAMADLNTTWNAQRAREGLEQGPPLSIHIGINSGPVAAGNIGSPHYVQYATIGDATNVASRISGVARGGEIVIDDGTQRLLPAGPFTVEALPPTRVKGKAEALQLHRVSAKR